MATTDIPLLDLSVWHSGTPDERRTLARRMDVALQDSGFLLVAGHGISAGLMAELRASAARFFALADEEKAPIATHVGGRGWIPIGGEANAYYGEDADPARADLKESLTIGRIFRTGDEVTDNRWFTDNVYPEQCPDLVALSDAFAEQVYRVHLDLLRMCAVALDLPEEFFAEKALRSPYTLNINHYPPLAQTGPALDGQYRVGAHTDWGVLTFLDRQPGYGGLQVQTKEGDWVDAPFEPGALTVNVGDLLARWVGDRWRSTRHRVLPPPAEAPNEDLISLIMFMEVDMDTVIAPLLPGSAYKPVLAADYFDERMLAATVS